MIRKLDSLFSKFSEESMSARCGQHEFAGKKTVATMLSGGISAAASFIPENVIVWRGSDSDFFKRAFNHHRMILKWVIEGKVSTNIEGVRFRLHPGDAVLYIPRQTHTTEKEGNSRFEYLAISFVSHNGDYTPLESLRNRVLSLNENTELLMEVVKAFLSRKHISRGIFSLSTVLSELVFRETKEIPSGDSDFEAISVFIRQNFLQDNSVKTIANHFQISTQQVRRIFSRNFNGITPGKLLRRQRMTFACSLLLNTRLSVTEISRKCCFCSPFAFSRAFKEAYGTSPSGYRITSNFSSDNVLCHKGCRAPLAIGN